jgi:hypothetical protein
VVCVGLLRASYPGLCHLRVRECWDTDEPDERGVIDQGPRQGPQCGWEAARGRTEDAASTEQWGAKVSSQHPSGDLFIHLGRLALRIARSLAHNADKSGVACPLGSDHKISVFPPWICSHETLLGNSPWHTIHVLGESFILGRCWILSQNDQELDYEERISPGLFVHRVHGRLGNLPITVQRIDD